VSVSITYFKAAAPQPPEHFAGYSLVRQIKFAHWNLEDMIEVAWHFPGAHEASLLV
jgi:hypothetical protein